MSALKVELEEKEEIRMHWERRRKQIEHETTKLQKLHKVQIERLRKRLFNAQQEEIVLDGQLSQTIGDKERKEEELWQYKRQETNVRIKLILKLSNYLFNF